MSVQQVRAYLKARGTEGVLELPASSATVELAAAALSVEPARIAKTLSFANPQGEGCILVVAAGDAKVHNQTFRERFGAKPRMLPMEEVCALTGHEVGGVCPFANPAGVTAYLDVSLQRFDTVFPACGSGNSAIELTCPQLFTLSEAADWVDVCKGWQPEEQ